MCLRFSCVVYTTCVALLATSVAAEYAPFTDPETRNSPEIGVPSAVQVDGRMGAAGYVLPIPAPPGTGGLTPSLALAFSSLMKHSEYGYGWTIGYFSRIERSTRFGIPCYGQTGCVNPRYESGDAFEVDGELLLEDATTSGRYHKKRKDFAKITRSGDTWTVITTDGMKFTYGATASGRLANPAAVPDPTFRWMLERIEDPRGNQIRILYTDFAEGTNLYPTAIRYSYNTKAGVDTARRIVQFVWELRGESFDVEDRPTSYRAGFKTQLSRRVRFVASGIVADDSSLLLIDNPADPNFGDPQPGVSMLAKHELVYATKPSGALLDKHATPYSKLIAVQRYGSDNVPFPNATTPIRTEFTYADPETEYPQSASTVATHGLGTAMFDYDGVMSEWVDNPNPVAPGKLSPRVTETTSGRLLDINGDLVLDRVLFTPQDIGAPTWEVALGTVALDGTPSYGTPVAWTWSAPTDKGAAQDIYQCSFQIGTCGAYLFGGVATDVNADGGYWRIRESYTIQDLSPATKDSLVTVADLLDIDGDGLPDRVISRSDGPWEVYLNDGGDSSGGSFTGPVLWDAPAIGSSGDNKRFLAFVEGYDDPGNPDATLTQVVSQLIDLNGDGRPDHIAKVDDLTAQVSYNSGTGFLAPVTRSLKDHGFISQFVVSGNTVTAEVFSTLKNFIDINDDGLVDRVFGPGENMPAGPVGSDNLVTYFNTGGGMTDSVSITYNDVPIPEEGVQESFTPAFDRTVNSANPIDTRVLDGTFLDFNGDGIVDLVKQFISSTSEGDAGDLKVYYGLGDGRFLKDKLVWKTHSVAHTQFGLHEEILGSPDVYDDALGEPGWVHGDPMMTGVLPLHSDADITASQVSDMPFELGAAHYHTSDPSANLIRDFRDVNGDGYADHIMISNLQGAAGNQNDANYAGFDRTWQVYLHPGPATLLTQVDNEYGGVTKLNYRPASQYADVDAVDLWGYNRNLNPSGTVKGMGRPTWVVCDQEVTDGRAGTATTVTQYEFAQPRYDTESRELLGMRMSDVILGERISPSVVDLFRIHKTFYQQVTIPSIPVIQETGIYESSAWTSRSRTTNNPTVTTTAEGAVFVEEMFTVNTSTEAGSEGSPSIRQEQRRYFNPTYGYLERVNEGGEDGYVFTGADNLDTVTCYPSVPNETDYLIAYPTETKTYYGAVATPTCASPQGQLISHTKLYYDDQTHGAAPTAGLVTRQEQLDPDPPYDTTSTRQEYDAYGNAERVWDPIAFDAASPTFTPGTQSKTIAYDAGFHAFVSTVTDAQGDVSSYSIDPRTGNVIKVLDANGYLICRSFDNFERLNGTLESSAAETSVAAVCDVQLAEYLYQNVPDAENQYVETRVFDEPAVLSTTSRTYFDGLGRTYKSSSTRRASEPNTHFVTVQAYDALGQVECESQPFETMTPGASYPCMSTPVYVEHAYDYLGRKNETLHSSLGLLENFLYFPPSGNTTQVTRTTFGTPPTSQTTRFDNRSRQISVVELGGDYTYIAYDPLGRIEEIDGPDVSTPNGPATTHPNIMVMAYDYLGRRTGLYKPNDPGILGSGRTWTFDYDKNGNMERMYSPRGAAKDVKYGYDILNRPVLKDFDPIGVDNGEDEHFIYDCTDAEHPFGIGRLCREENKDLIYDYVYDLRGNVDTKEVIYRDEIILGHTDGTFYKFTHQYDLTGRMTSKRYPDKEWIDFTYDGAVLSEVASRANPTRVKVDALQYHDNGQLEQIHYAEGDFTTTYEFDPLDYRLDRIHTVSNGTATSVQDLNYSYDVAGNITTITDGLGLLSQSFEYDFMHRLAKATGTGSNGYGVKHYGIDDAGNLTCKGATTSLITDPTCGTGSLLEYGGSSTAGAHAVTLKTEGAQPLSYDYDADGNLETRGLETFAWDSQSRLEEITLGSSDYLTHAYDNSGRRVRKTRCDTSGAVGCAGWPSGTATVDRLYVDDDYEIDMVNGSTYKHIFVAGKRVITAQYEGRGKGCKVQ